MTVQPLLTDEQFAALRAEALLYKNGTILRRGDGHIWKVVNGYPVHLSALTRKGEWGQVVGGKVVYAQDLRLDEIEMEDFSHALSNQCRWGGTVSEFYSVAQHAVYVGLRAYQIAAEEGFYNPMLAFWYGLRHDDSEGYLTDVPTPIKMYLPFYYEVEAEVQKKCMARYTYTNHFKKRIEDSHRHLQLIVKRADVDLLFMERDKLITDNSDPYVMEQDHPHCSFEVFEGKGLPAELRKASWFWQPVRRKFFCWSPEQARAAYRQCFNLFKDGMITHEK